MEAEFSHFDGWRRDCLHQTNMLLVLTLIPVGTFAAIVLRRLKKDIEQEQAFRSKLKGHPASLSLTSTL
jgi:hypothetical protein